MRRVMLLLSGILFLVTFTTAGTLSYRIAVQDAPFALALESGAGPLPLLGGLDTPAFYVARREEQTAIRTCVVTMRTDMHLVADADLADGRKATLEIAPGPQDSIRITFRVIDKGEFEKLGVVLGVGAEEGFYGLMERVVQGSQGLSWDPGMKEGLNLRGQIVDLYTLPTLSIYAPFFVSSRGWGLYVEGDWPSTYRFGIDARRRRADHVVTVETEDPTLSFLLFPSTSPIDTLERYARLTGTTQIPPDYIFGPGRWRDESINMPFFYDGTANTSPFNTMVMEDVLMMAALGIPCRWIVIDRPWAAGTFGYGDMRIDAARFPHFDEMVRWLDGRGISTLLWLGPWVMDGQREVAVSNGFDVSPTFPYLPNAALIDFTNPDAVRWWSDQLAPLLDSGIAGFKLDRGEEKPPDGQVFRGAYADGTSYREGHNAYPLWFAQAAFQAGRSVLGEMFVSLYRAGWPGMSEVAVAWGGDSDPSEWGLRSAMIGLQRAAVLNTPIWGSDTGGYNTRPPREVLARWLAFSAFCPIMEVGPTANLAPWNWLPDESPETMTVEGYPESAYYDAELLAIWSMYAQIHEDLGGLLHSLAVHAHENGTPMVRPMIIAYPDDPRFVDVFDQYLLGSDLLVRPVWERGMKQVEVLLPEGVWVDLWTGRSYTGPGSVRVDCPLYAIPLFGRSGAASVLGDLNSRWTDAVLRTAHPPDLAELLACEDGL